MVATHKTALLIPYASESIEAEKSGVKLSPGVRVFAAITVLN